MKQAAGGSAYCLLHADFLLGLFFNHKNGCDIPPKRQSTFTRLQSIISSKTELFHSDSYNNLKSNNSHFVEGKYGRIPNFTLTQYAQYDKEVGLI
jgi:hypothetical protein